MTQSHKEVGEVTEVKEVEIKKSPFIPLCRLDPLRGAAR
jgi:hypothetical protein